MEPDEIRFAPARPVEADARLAMAWRNDPAARASAYHHDEKVWDRFWPEWRDDYLGAPPLPVFALAAGEPVAFLRFRPDRHPRGLAGHTVDLSIIVAPGARGRGTGKAVLRAIHGHLAAQGVDSVVAEVRVGNAASLAAFSAAGFTPLGVTSKTIADTGEVCAIERFVAELTPTHWRKGGVFVIAEAGSNWRMGTAKRDRDMARALIEVAAAAGADAVKFQTYRPETTYVANAGGSDYLAEAGIAEDIGQIFADLAMPYDMIPDLAAAARKAGVAFMSTGFSPADFAAIDPHTAVHKIASYEISHPHLIRLAARSGKPTVMSTGASDAADIAWAVDTFRAAGGRDLCLLQCTARYPAPVSALNLRAIPWLAWRFGCAAGLSDHSREPVTGPAAAVALGARVIEKHYTLDNRLPGPDHAFAATPAELKAMVAAIRETEAALGDGVKRPLAEEAELAAYARRGLQASRAIVAGEVLREGDNVAILRPGKQRLGAHPRHLDVIDGRRARRAIPPGDGVQRDDAEP
jgi:N-acetylneuraminate synthase